MLLRRIPYIIGIAVLILCIPFIAMQFTEEVNWDFSDFIVMGFLLFVGGMALTYIKVKVKSRPRRILLFLAVIAFFLFLWAELAVGIFGTPFAGS